MNKDEIKETLTTGSIKKILDYYNADYVVNERGEIVSETICHNKNCGSHKLYYYPDNQMFRCYTDCSESFDVYEFVQKVNQTRGNQINFTEAIQTVSEILGIHYSSRKKIVGFNSDKGIDDWDWINKIQRRKVRKPEFEVLDESILKVFPRLYPKEWYEEGISIETMYKYGIRFNYEYNQTIIPHRNHKGQLIGIRTRNWRDVSRGKYMPLYYNKTLYSHALGYNLYGLYENLEAIKRLKKVMIVEGEKSAMKSHSHFKDNNFCVALCGSNMNQHQAGLLLELGVEQVIIAVDRDYLFEPDETYYNKVKKIAKHFINKTNVYHITDKKEQISFKSCLLDEDRETIVDVMDKQKFLITNIDELK